MIIYILSELSLCELSNMSALCNALLFESTHVSSAVASTQTFTFIFIQNDRVSLRGHYTW